LECNSGDYAVLSKIKDELRFIFITSSVKITESILDYDISVKVLAHRSQHPKCVRCWHQRADVITDENHQHHGLCGRCVENVFGEGEKRLYA